MMERPTISFWFTDWSGVISDDRRPVYEATNRTLQHFGGPRLSWDYQWSNLAGSLEAYVRQELVRAGRPVPDDPRMFMRFEQEYNDCINDGIVPTMLPQADAFLSYLQDRRVPVTVISSHMENNVQQEAYLYGLHDRIAFIKGTVKRKSDVITGLVDILDLPPDRVAYIGDMENDIVQGNLAGVHTIGIPGYHTADQLLQKNPTLGVVSSLMELPERVRFEPF